VKTKEDLEKSTGAVYRTSGAFMIKVEDTDALKADLDESIETMEVRIASLERQENSLKEKYTALQETINKAMGKSAAVDDDEE